MSTEALMVNQDLLKQRMMRGALRGHVTEEENAVGRYCQGKLDNGRPCRIVVVGKGDYCKRHQKEIDALAAGAPIEPGQIERSVAAEAQPKMSTGGGSAVTPADPAELSASPLSRLLKPAPVADLLPSTFILLDFNQEEFAAIQSEKVTPADLKQLALWLIAGELCRIPSGTSGLASLSGDELCRRVGAAS